MAHDTRPVYTLTSTPAVPESHDEALAIARSLRDRLRARGDEAQELRRLPDATVADLLESGLYGVMKPKRYGGSELGTETMVDVAVELASAEPSAGWVYMLWTAHMWMQAQWPVQAMDEMFENPNMLASSIVSSVGDVVPVAGGYAWTGRGFFSSGVDHCNWLTAAVPIKRDGVAAERRWLLIPREDFEIVDDWNTVGLRGTGSKTIEVNEVFVPEYRTLAQQDAEEGTGPGREVNTHPMYGGTVRANFGGAMSAPAIGAAKGFLGLFLERMGSKISRPDETHSPYLPDGIPTTLGRLSYAAAQVDAAHALLRHGGQYYGCIPAKDVSMEERQRLRRNSPFCAQQSRRAVNTLYEECGGTGLLDSSLIQRFWRDTNAASAHHGLTWDWQADVWPKAALGFGTEMSPT